MEDLLGARAEQHDLDVRVEPMLQLQGKSSLESLFTGIFTVLAEIDLARQLVVDDQELRQLEPPSINACSCSARKP